MRTILLVVKLYFSSEGPMENYAKSTTLPSELRILPILSSSNVSWSASAKKKRIIIEEDYSMGKRTQKI